MLGHFAEAVDLGAPGRVGAFHLIDGEDGVLGVMSVEVLVESHDDGGDFFAGVVLDFCAVGSACGSAVGADLVHLRYGAADLADAVEAQAEQEQGRENDAHGHDGHAEAVAVKFGEVLDFVVGILDDVGARRGDVVVVAAGAHLPFAGTVLGAGVRLVGEERRRDDHFVDEGLAVGIIDADPVVLAGLKLEAGVECAAVGLAVGEEHHVLALGYLRVDITQRDGILSRIGLVVGEVDARYFEGCEVGVEELDPCTPASVLVDEAVVVDHHHFVEAQGRAALGGCRKHGGAEHQQSDGYGGYYLFHYGITGGCCRASWQG